MIISTFLVRCWRTALRIQSWRWRSWRTSRSWRSWTSGRLWWILREWLTGIESWRGWRRKGRKKRMSKRQSKWRCIQRVCFKCQPLHIFLRRFCLQQFSGISLNSEQFEHVCWFLREMLERALVKRLRDSDSEEEEESTSLHSKNSTADKRPTDILTADKPSEEQVHVTFHTCVNL